MTTKLLFVCLGNICRSPTAENLMTHLVQRSAASLTGDADAIVCDSAGTSGYHIGDPPDARMQAAARQRGLTLTGKARQFMPEDFERFDWILAMDRSNYRDIVALAPDAAARDRVRLICDFCQRYPDRDVPDPYYGGAAGFDYVIDLLTDACSGLLNFLRSEASLDSLSDLSSDLPSDPQAQSK